MVIKMNSVNNVNQKRQKEAFLESLGNGEKIKKSCEAAGITEMTIWRWRKEYKLFNRQVLYILESRTQIVEDALFTNAINGNVAAQIFWLKNRAKDRWKDKFDYKVDLEEVIVVGAEEEEKEEDIKSEQNNN